MTFSDMREHPNFRRILGSVECKALKRESCIIGIFLVVYLLLILVPIATSMTGTQEQIARNGHIVMTFLFVIMLVLGGTGYYIYRWWNLFSHIDRYTFTEVMLNQPHQGYKGVIYFDVEVMDRRGNRHKKVTRMIFGRHDPVFEEYLNKKAIIAYNDETDTVVVIGKV